MPGWAFVPVTLVMPGLTGHLLAVPVRRLGDARCAKMAINVHFAELPGREKHKIGPKCPFAGPSLPPSAVKPSFSAFFVGSTVVACSRAVIFAVFCRFNCSRVQPGRHFRAFLMAEGAGRCSFAQRAGTGPARSLDVSTPPHTVPAFGQARNVVEQVPSCRLRRHRSLLRPSRIPVSAHSLRNQRPAPFRPSVSSQVLTMFGDL